MAGTAAAKNLRYRRALVKLSGEALAGDKGYGIDLDVLTPLPATLPRRWPRAPRFPWWSAPATSIAA